MREVVCAGCGSKELVEDAGYAVCVYCRTRHVPEPKDAPQTTTVIALANDVAALLQRCRDDPANRRRYANLVLDLDPTNREAQRYL